MKNGENFQLLYDLASKLKAAGMFVQMWRVLANSMLLFDAQWGPHERLWTLDLYPTTCKSDKREKLLPLYVP